MMYFLSKKTLDQKAIDQQKTLENSGIPGFHVTTNPTETKVQMYLLEFITRLDAEGANSK